MMTFSMSVVDRSTRLELEAEEEENAMSAKELEEAKKREKEEQAKKVKPLNPFYCLNIFPTNGSRDFVKLSSK